ncbi:MAG: hypothetical protein QOJ07_409 [Thermoleophilaceae bacterium]|jgi:hypothetical protein|nr:hypothetical protein [Thermoleophilaceae bacterium]
MRRGAIATLVIALTMCAPAAAATRQTTDQPDDLTDHQQVHVMYVVPKDGTDRGLDENGTVESSVASWQQWLRGQTGGLGMNLDTASGQLDVTFVRLSVTTAQVAAKGAYVNNEIGKRLKLAGFDAPNKVYLVYYDAPVHPGSCGDGAWPPAAPGKVAAIYLHGELPEGIPPCDSNPLAGPGDPPGYFEFVGLHEVMHTLGFVPRCAPNETRDGHVSDSPTDLMYAGDEPWDPQVLDFGRDDYFKAGRRGCLDLAGSGYLENGPTFSCVTARDAVAGDKRALTSARAALKRAHTTRARARARARIDTANRKLRQDRKRAAGAC